MRALIRDMTTGRFYAPGWRWTTKRAKACDFESTFQALSFAEDKGLRGVEVVLTFADFGSDVAISLDCENQPAKSCRERRGKGLSFRRGRRMNFLNFEF